MKTTEAIAVPCIDVAERPAIPTWSFNPDGAASQQLAAADEAYVAELERYAKRSDALLIRCTSQPTKEQP